MLILLIITNQKEMSTTIEEMGVTLYVISLFCS